jgi:nifR3 family TIM-barrel protein
MTEDLSAYLRQPLSIGSRTIRSRLVLAPMTFLGHVAFRELVSQYGGCGLLFSEMCSAKAIPHENRFVSPYFRWRDAERAGLAIQIFGNDPVVMALAARRIEAEGLFGVDINFGCADGAICRQNCGAALLKDPDLAGAIVSAVREAVAFPLTVKFRIGWQDDPQTTVQLAKRFEAAGADALVFHPRVAPDRRSRPARWEYIALVKRAVEIPVLGNGDVFDRTGCLNMIRQTGCDGVAIGRMAVARPWIFAEWTEGMKPGADIFYQSAVELMALLQKHYEPSAAIRRFRRFAFYFTANFRFGHTLYSQITAAGNFPALEAILSRFFSCEPDILTTPNMNYFK